MKFSHKFKRILTASAMTAAFTAALGVTIGNVLAQSSNAVINPFSPAVGHPYRHGVVPTKETHDKMEAWRKANVPTTAAASKTLSYGGGVNGIGVTSGQPKVYLVVYGTQWGTAGTDANGNMTLSKDSKGAVPYLQNLFKHIGTGGELWSGVMTQYCDGPLVAKGATSCPSAASHVGYPTGGTFAGIWYDNTGASPTSATETQLAQEAINAAAHFGNTTAASNRYAQYVILSPSGTHPDGFNTSTGLFCAWHDSTADSVFNVNSPYGDIAFTNMPYATDNSQCSMSLSGGAGTLDSFSIIEGHEYAETISDQNPPGGWVAGGQENADECAWIQSGQGAMQIVTMGDAKFAMQSTWSNDTNRCDISHPIIADSGGTTTTTAGGTTTTTSGDTTTSAATTTTTSAATTTTTTATTTTTTMATACYTASNPAHVAAGRAFSWFGFDYANGSNQFIGYNSSFYITSLKKIGNAYYLVASCN
jgi:serine protease